MFDPVKYLLFAVLFLTMYFGTVPLVVALIRRDQTRVNALLDLYTTLFKAAAQAIIGVLNVFRRRDQPPEVPPPPPARRARVARAVKTPSFPAEIRTTFPTGNGHGMPQLLEAQPLPRPSTPQGTPLVPAGPAQLSSADAFLGAPLPIDLVGQSPRRLGLDGSDRDLLSNTDFIEPTFETRSDPGVGLQPARLAIVALAALIAARDHGGAKSGQSERSVESIQSRTAGEPRIEIISRPADYRLRRQRLNSAGAGVDRPEGT